MTNDAKVMDGGRYIQIEISRPTVCSDNVKAMAVISGLGVQKDATDKGVVAEVSLLGNQIEIPRKIDTMRIEIQGQTAADIPPEEIRAMRGQAIADAIRELFRQAKKEGYPLILIGNNLDYVYYKDGEIIFTPF